MQGVFIYLEIPKFFCKFRNGYMKEILITDISEIKDFVKYGDTFTKVRDDQDKHRQVWKRTSKGGHISYEVWIGKKHKNPDGSIMYLAPCSSDFGLYGFAVMDNKYAQPYIDFLMTSDDLSPEARYNFKKSLSLK